MRYVKLNLILGAFMFPCLFTAQAVAGEKEISLDDLDQPSLNLQSLNPGRLPGKSYDDRARQTIITGYAVTSYTYNNNGVAHGHGNELHFGQDPADNSRFGFNLMEIGFTKRYSDYAWVAAAVEIGQHFHDGELETETELDAGEVHLVAPIGNGIDFALGKFNSPVSFEQEDAPLLLQASHSLAYQFASPSKMVGLMATYPIQENLEVRGAVFNGWNRNAGDGENNDSKSFLLQVGYAPLPWLDTKVSYLIGAEQEDNDDDQRHVIDIVATMTPWRNWILGFEFAYGRDENSNPAENNGDDFEFYSGQATVHYDFTRWLGTTARYSFYDDKDGGPDIHPRQDRTMHEVTFAPTFHISPELLGYMGFGVIPRTQHLLSGIDLRLEYRHDWVDEDSASGFFENEDGGRESTRDSFIAELVASF